MTKQDKVEDQSAVAVDNQSIQAPPKPDVELFADGVATLAVRSGILKIELYQVVGSLPDGSGEFRRLSQRIALPLNAFNELKSLMQQIEVALTTTQSENK